MNKTNVRLPRSAVFAALALSGALAAQDNPAPAGGTVRIWITALHKGSPVTDLRKEDLELSVDKVEHPISTLTFNPAEPLNLGLLIDTSGSESRSWRAPMAALASTFFRKTVRPGDKAYIASFADERFLNAPPTDDLSFLNLALQQVAARRPHGGTALYDAMVAYCHPPKPGLRPHQALVVLTDGQDNASKFRPDEAMEMVQQTHTQIYFIATMGEDNGPFRVRTPSSRGAMSRMTKAAKATGGKVYLVPTDRELERAFDSIATIIRAQYALDFTFNGIPSEKKLTRIKVDCKRPGVEILAAEKY